MRSARASWISGAVWAASLALVALALSLVDTPSVRADADDRTGYIELRVVQSITTYTQPNPASPIAATLAPGTVVNIIRRQVGSDGQLWFETTTPARQPLGWMRLADLAARTTVADSQPVFVPLPFVLPFPFVSPFRFF